MMLTATDTFIKFLSFELAGNPPVHWVRATASDETAAVLHMKALNISVMGWRADVGLREVDISLDILGDDERAVIQWVERVQMVLEIGFTQEMNYTASPRTATGSCVEWDPQFLSFDVMRSDHAFVHYNALLTLRHVK